MKIFKSAHLEILATGGDISHQLGCFLQPMSNFTAPELFPIPNPNYSPRNVRKLQSQCKIFCLFSGDGRSKSPISVLTFKYVET